MKQILFTPTHAHQRMTRTSSPGKIGFVTSPLPKDSVHFSASTQVLFDQYPDPSDQYALGQIISGSHAWQKSGLPYLQALGIGMEIYKLLSEGEYVHIDTETTGLGVEYKPPIATPINREEQELIAECVSKILETARSLEDVQNALKQAHRLKETYYGYYYPKSAFELLKKTGSIERARMYQVLNNIQPAGDDHIYYVSDPLESSRSWLRQWISDENQPMVISPDEFQQILRMIWKDRDSNQELNTKLLKAIMKGDLSPQAFMRNYENLLAPTRTLSGRAVTAYLKCLEHLLNKQLLNPTRTLYGPQTAENSGQKLEAFSRIMKAWTDAFKEETDGLTQPLFEMAGRLLRNRPVGQWIALSRDMMAVMNTLNPEERADFHFNADEKYSYHLINRLVEFYGEAPERSELKQTTIRVIQWARTPPPMIPSREWVKLLTCLTFNVANETDLNQKHRCLRVLGTPGRSWEERAGAWQKVLAGRFTPAQVAELVPTLEGLRALFPDHWKYLQDILVEPAISSLSTAQVKKLFTEAVIEKKQPEITEIARLDFLFGHHPERLQIVFDTLRDSLFENQETPWLENFTSALTDLTNSEAGHKAKLTNHELRVLLGFLTDFRQTTPDRKADAAFVHLLTFVAKNVSPSAWSQFLSHVRQTLEAIPPSDRASFETSESKMLMMSVLDQCKALNFNIPAMTFLESVMNDYTFLKRSHPGLEVSFLLNRMIRNTETLANYSHYNHHLRILLEGTTDPAERNTSLDRVLNLLKPDITLSEQGLSQIRHALDKGRPFAHLIPFLVDATQNSLKPDMIDQFLALLLPQLEGLDPQTQQVQERAQALPMVIRSLLSSLRENPELFQWCLREIVGMQNWWKEAATMFGTFMGTTTFANLRDADWYREHIANDPEKLENLHQNLRLITHLAQPNRFLNEYLLHQDQINPRLIHDLYYMIEYKTPQYGQGMLPELLALVTPYLAHIRQTEPNVYSERVNQISGSLTRLYNYPILSNGLQGIVLNTWAKVGTLGLSFPKWQYDAMRQWKGAGPSEKASLLMQSGIFKPTPSRLNDKVYHGGYYHYNPATGVSVELRRAYIVISKPGEGTLVIRNSSPVFGRDLLKEPAYYSPDMLYTQPGNFFNPEYDLPGHFQSVLARELNDPYDPTARQQYHLQMQALLEAFDETMAPYVAWKCGFKDGSPPAGFREMIRVCLQSAQNNGTMTPFGKKKNIKLAWVNSHALPLPVTSFNVNDPKHQQEMELYLSLADRKIAITRPEEYEQKLPNLMAFLRAGLKDNLELVLSE